MLLPVLILASLSLVSGILLLNHLPHLVPTIFSSETLKAFDELSKVGVSDNFKHSLAAVLAFAFGVAIPFLDGLRSDLRKIFKGLYQIVSNKFYIDQLLDNIIVKPIYAIGAFINKIFDPVIIEGTIRGCLVISEYCASLARGLVQGELRGYVAMLVGSLLFVIFFYMGL